MEDVHLFVEGQVWARNSSGFKFQGLGQYCSLLGYLTRVIIIRTSVPSFSNGQLSEIGTAYIRTNLGLCGSFVPARKTRNHIWHKQNPKLNSKL